jgi:hypothetical protein
MVFNKVKPKLTVNSHIVKLYGRNENGLMKRTRAKGVVIVGEFVVSIS